jgi:hypothetical protein
MERVEAIAESARKKEVAAAATRLRRLEKIKELKAKKARKNKIIGATAIAAGLAYAGKRAYDKNKPNKR